MKNTLHILLFAGLAEQIGSSLISFEVPHLPVTAGELKQLLSQAYPAADSLIKISFLAVNQEYALESTTISSSDEVALIPPVSGGDGQAADSSSQNMFESEDGLCSITFSPLQAEETLSKVLHPNHGASLVFVGTTREITGSLRTIKLEYEAYIPMAIRKMDEIRISIESKWPGTMCAMTHRLGTVGIGESSIVIAVSSPHRDTCYEASRYAIEEVKRTVPIWKKEIWADGSEWKGAQTGPWDPLSFA